MPRPSLNVTVRETQRNVARLAAYRSGAGGLDPTFQYLVSELLLLRLVAILEASIDDLACKLVSGAAYMNGIQPSRIQSAKSIAEAEAIMLTSRRGGRSRYLSWTKASVIRDNVYRVMSPRDPFVFHAGAHGNVLNEMRVVRNYVAHNSSDARKEFQQIVRYVYGANASISVGAFLTSRTRRGVAKIDEYIRVVPAIVTDLAGG